MLDKISAKDVNLARQLSDPRNELFLGKWSVLESVESGQKIQLPDPGYTNISRPEMAVIGLHMGECKILTYRSTQSYKMCCTKRVAQNPSSDGGEQYFTWKRSSKHLKPERMSSEGGMIGAFPALHEPPLRIIIWKTHWNGDVCCQNPQDSDDRL